MGDDRREDFIRENVLNAKALTQEGEDDSKLKAALMAVSILKDNLAET